MSGWTLSMQEIEAKANALRDNASSASHSISESEPLVSAAESAAGSKRILPGASADASKPVSRQRTTRLSTPPIPAAASSVGDQSQAPNTNSSDPSTTSPVVGDPYSIVAKVIPSNLLFGRFGSLGYASLEDIIKMSRPHLVDLAVTLEIFNSPADAIPVFTVPTLRQMVSMVTGSAASYTMEPSGIMTFPDGVTVERPHFPEPAA